MHLTDNFHIPSVRAQVVTRRTYNRPLDTSGSTFETWTQTIDRVIDHQRWLWERARGKKLGKNENEELEKLRTLMIARKVLPAGRTLWLGGTEVAQRREASMFNCSFLRVETVHDVVDAFWLLLQGCGVGFEPVVGTLNGFSRPVDVEVIRSTRDDKGNPHNTETIEHMGEWRIQVGDSAEAWAKAIGKMLSNKVLCDKLVLDFSQVRPAGERLKGYGWISSGDETISKAFVAIASLLNRKAGCLLSRVDILDILNHLGTTLSSRRSAEIAVVPYGDPEWREFATAKKDHFEANPQRAQSNNSLLFYHRPDRGELEEVFALLKDGGGSEPGFINAQAALKRAPWFKGVNPCAEILLNNKGFCNLSEVNLSRFNGEEEALYEAIYLVARSNYRQTCVDLRDGILQNSWHEMNAFLRLTGVGMTGIVGWEWQDSPEHLKAIKACAHKGVYSMSSDLKTPQSVCVTTIKPSGTLSKIMDTTEGIHKPLGRYVFNNVSFSKHDPLVQQCREAGYRVFDHPYAPDASLVTFPVSWEKVEFHEFVKDGKTLHVNLESAVEQLERYKFWMQHYVTHNASITVSYDESEVPQIIEWLLENWDDYVGVSFLYRTDPTKTAEDLGYPYLPQEVVTKEEYDAYVSGLGSLDLEASNSLSEIMDDECAGGSCPVR